MTRFIFPPARFLLRRGDRDHRRGSLHHDPLRDRQPDMSGGSDLLLRTVDLANVVEVRVGFATDTFNEVEKKHQVQLFCNVDLDVDVLFSFLSCAGFPRRRRSCGARAAASRSSSSRGGTTGDRGRSIWSPGVHRCDEIC